MKKIADRIFGSPNYLWGLMFAAKYGAAVQFLAALFFVGLSRAGGPLGCLQAAFVLHEAALVTVTLAVIFRLTVHFLRKGGFQL